jgi:hypothetical protein
MPGIIIFMLVTFVLFGLIAGILCARNFRKAPFYFIDNDTILFIICNIGMVVFSPTIYSAIFHSLSLSEGMAYIFIWHSPFCIVFLNSLLPHYLVSLRSSNNSIYGTLLFSVAMGSLAQFVLLSALVVPFLINGIQSVIMSFIFL